jgi:hypothetical protein
MSPKSHDSPQKRNEDKIELIFKSKRENVYTAGVSLDNRINYHPRNIKKSLFQSKLIRTYTLHAHTVWDALCYTARRAVNISLYVVVSIVCYMFCTVYHLSILSCPVLSSCAICDTVLSTLHLFKEQFYYNTKNWEILKSKILFTIIIFFQYQHQIR